MERSEKTLQLQAYMASALSRLTPDQRKAVFFLSEAVDEVCRRHAIFLYQPRKVTDPLNNPDIPDEEVYLIDRSKVASADLVILLCDYPSYGAGQENEIAAQAGVPIVYLIEKGHKIPRMLFGSFARIFKVEYEDPDDLKEKLDVLLGKIVPALLATRRERENEQDLRIGLRVRELRHKSRLDERDVADRLSVKKDFVEMLERENETVSNPGLVHLNRLAQTFGVPISYLLGGTDMEREDKVKRQSFMQLWSLRDEQLLTPQEAEELFTDYLGELRIERASAVGARQRTPLSKADWKKRIQKLRERKGGLF